MLRQKKIPFNQKLSPVRPELFLDYENLQPTEELPVECLTTQSARTFMIRGEHGVPTIEPSSLVKGSWEVGTGGILLPGLLGRKATRGVTICRDTSKDVTHVTRSTPAKPHIPNWLTRGYHPVLAPRERKTAYRRTRKGRVIDHPDSHIFNGESREPIYPINYPECCICRIWVYTSDQPGGTLVFRERATGFMVGSRIMMTSGHMYPEEPYADWMMKVIPGSYDEVSVFGPSFVTYASDIWAYNTDPGNDFMLCRLYDPIGDTAGYFGAISYNDDWEDMNVWSMCGYPWDVGALRPVIERGIAVVDDDDGDDVTLPDGNSWDTTQIESKADTADGASGSPLYSWFDDGIVYAIGANKGTEEDWELGGSDLHEVASGGDGFVEFVKWGRAAWA